MSGPHAKPTPRTVHIAVTGCCNLHCRYCFYADEMIARRDLNTQQWLACFDQLGRLGVMDVCLTGGEVLTRPDLFELIDGVIANRMRYTLLSNGTLVDEKLLARFEVGKRRLRLEVIQISIDGARAEVHDQSRPHSFDRAIRGLRLLKEARFPLTVRVTLNHHNLDDLENIAHLLLDEIGIPSITTNEAMPIGSGCQSRDPIALTAVEKQRAMDTIARLLVRYPGRLKATAGPQAKLDQYAEMERARTSGERPASWEMGRLTACGCIFSTLDILHDGTIVPCHMLPDLKLGNVTTDSLVDIWRAHPILAALRARREIPMQQVAGCADCEWADFCNGSCPGLAHQLTGDFNRANPEDCYRRFLMEVGP